MFADDPAILKMYDNDEVAFKGRTSQKTKDVCTFLKYARKYNRKHGTVSVEKDFLLEKTKAGK
jgi:cytochrome c1